MTLRAAKLRSQLVILADLATGRFNAALVGDIKGLLIPGIGIVDVRSDIRAAPRKGGGLALTGKARADVRRFDNGFFRGLAGGPPRLTSDLALGAGGLLRLSSLKLESPVLHLSATGYKQGT